MRYSRALAEFWWHARVEACLRVVLREHPGLPANLACLLAIGVALDALRARS